MTRGWRIRTATFCAAGALSVVITITPPAGAYFTSGAETNGAQATAVKPIINGPVFNDPIGTVEQQSAIITQLERLIDSAPAGEEIQGSVFEFGHLRIANRLIAAYDRGVRVKLIVDAGSTDNAAYTAVRDRLGSDETVNSWVVVCNDQFPTQHRGCIGTRTITYSTGPQYAYNHNKFFLFSRLAFDDGTAASSVVWQSSSNLSGWYEVESYNDSVTFSDGTVYHAYRQYFADLRSHRYSLGGNNNYYWGTPSGSTYRVHFFPRQEAAGEDPVRGTQTDTVDNVLDLVSCYYTDPQGIRRQTDIRIVMWAFTRPGLADKLAAKRRAGCWVDIVYNPDSMSASVKSALTFSGGPQLTPCKFTVAPGRDIRPHHKTMLLDGEYNGSITPRVYTGSHNFAVSALRQADEALLRIASATYHAAFLSNFYKIRDTCRSRHTAR